ncbi:MAG: MFS transporter [Dehalococcoidales bacterium]|nr:MFS transporter [Dehalococcoidales bacterium]
MTPRPEIYPVNKSVVIFIATLSSFLTPFTLSSVNIALPTIGKELSLNAIELSWVATAYLLASAVFLIPIGRFADIQGRKKIFLTGIIIDGVATLLCIISHSGIVLIAFRAVQGLGAAMIFGTGVAILTSTIPASERGRALGINVAAVYGGLSVGPLAGGAMTTYFGWRSIFVLNAAISLIIILAVIWKLRGEWADARGEKFDITGSIIYSLALVAVMFGFSELPDMTGFWLLLAGAAGLAIFIVWELKQKYPVFKMVLFIKNKVFAFSNLAALINYSATYSASFLLSLYLQYIKGFPPEQAGLILIAQPIIQVIVSPIAGSLSDKFEPRVITSSGMALTTAGLIMLIFLTDNTSLGYIIAGLMVLGLGFGLFSSPNSNAVMSSVDRKEFGVASGILGTMRTLGQAFSLGVAMLLFALFIGKVQITPLYYPDFLYSTRVAFIIAAALCFTGIFASAVRGKTHAGETG